MFEFLKRGAVSTGAQVVPEVKASAAGRVAAWGTSGKVAWSARDVVTLTKVGFLGNPVGFRAVRLIAEAAAALPLVLQDSVQRFEVHPVFIAGAPSNSASAPGCSRSPVSTA